MNKLFTIEFDSTLSYWDFKTKENIPRPDSHGLVELLAKYGKVSLYSNSSKYLADVFLYKMYPVRYSSDISILSNVVTNLLPYDMMSKFDVVDISAYFKHKKFMKPPFQQIHVIPSFLGQMIQEDDELSKLKMYLERKLDHRESLSSHNFSDWEDRISILYNDLTTN
jgi:hypothetical protein